jgi:hypothetical protein
MDRLIQLCAFVFGVAGLAWAVFSPDLAPRNWIVAGMCGFMAGRSLAEMVD